MDSTARDLRNRLNLGWLVKLRWAVILGQVATMLATAWLLQLRLPAMMLGGIIALEVLTNALASWYLHSGRTVRTASLSALMLFDVVMLATLLYLTGGPHNPFSFLFLVHVALAAVVLPMRHAIAMAAVALLGSGLLFVDYLPLETVHSHHGGHGDHAGHDMWLHLQGMWVASAIGAVLILYFVSRVTLALARGDAELLMARERAERFEALATLAAGAAHELSSPLGTIAVAARELERQTGNAAVGEDARLIREETERCRRIIQRLAVDAAAGGRGQGGALDLGALLRETVAGMPEGERVRLELPERVEVEATIEPHLLGQAFDAVIGNALQASSEPVRLSCEERVGRVVVSVIDRGPGMDEAESARAVEPFFSTKGTGEGMGLGLFVAHSVIDRAGGSLEIDSKPGAGTTVRVALRSGRNTEESE